MSTRHSCEKIVIRTCAPHDNKNITSFNNIIYVVIIIIMIITITYDM